MLKKCSKCDKSKSVCKFYKNKKYKDGLSCWCRKCSNEYNIDWKKDNLEKTKEHKKRYRNNNSKKITEYRKNYYQNNKEKIIKYQVCYAKEKYSVDKLFRLLKNIRNRIIKSIKINSKSCNTSKLLGCTINQLKTYLESHFTENMTWNNHSLYGWHIDHIIPCSSFDLSKPEEQRKCFHYSNLQPLWAKDNLRKSDKKEYYNGTKNFAIF